MDFTLSPVLLGYNGAACAASDRVALNGATTERAFSGATWRVSRVSTEAPGLADHTFRFDVTAGTAKEAGAALEFAFAGWSRGNYVLVPAAVYAGNRFRALKLPYSPRMPEEDCTLNPPLTMSDVPRLEVGEAPSLLELKAGDMATPAFAVYAPALGRAVLVLFEASSAWGETGLRIEETAGNDQAFFRVLAPGIRSKRYTHMDRNVTSPDRAADQAAGASVEIRVRVLTFACGSEAALFQRYFAERKALAPQPERLNRVPFTKAFSLIEEKYNRECWEEKTNLYLTEPNRASSYTWQAGWCGGIINTFALTYDGSAITRERSWKNLDFVLTHGIAPSGLVYGKCTLDGKFITDFCHDTKRPYTIKWHLTRRTADVLFYALKQVDILERRGAPIPAAWHVGLQKMAEGLVRVWKRYGQLGHFLNTETGEIAVGGTCSGALAPAGLILAARRYNLPHIAAAAAEIGEHFYRDFTARGVTTGGPGDAVQVPDSESGYALVEGFVALFEHTGNGVWLQRAEQAAQQASSWVMTYDYAFPAKSEFGRLNMRSLGTVFANAQNKHSAPGICTHSGLGLLRIFRATGDRRYLELLRDIAHTLPQHISRDDRPISDPSGRAMPSGYINERVNTSDWDNNLGGVFYGSCWCEVSTLLTCVEVPGVYFQPDTGYALAIDHVEATSVARATGDFALRLHNPTPFDAVVRVLRETEAERSKVLPANPQFSYVEVAVKAGATVEI